MIWQSKWKSTKAELVTFIEEPNEKHKTIKFDFQILPRKITFLDIMLYKDKNENIQTTLCSLNAKSEHQRSLKNSIPYNKALRLKTICSTTTECGKNYAIIKQQFLDRQYKEDILDEKNQEE